MANIKMRGISGKRAEAKLGKVRRVRRAHYKVLSPYSSQSTTDMLDASRIITAYVKNNKIEVTPSSASVKKIVANAIEGKELTETARILQKLNHAIVLRNARENIPTDKTKLLYAELVQED